ncbi:MAG: hypothetical protein DRH12_01620 [Deltaproteobacteria bacterium]|nr:MAG: hypothetical protein DRH12_01620 [Deltaproteobacteria bacterium]
MRRVGFTVRRYAVKGQVTTKQMKRRSEVTIAASMDIGSYTARLLVAKLKDGNSIEPIVRERIYTRVGEDKCFLQTGTLSDEAQLRIIQALKRLHAQALQYGAEETFIAATGVIRKASNNKELALRVYKETGLELEIISGYQEAILTAKAVLSALSDLEPPLVVFDLGGGTTEFFCQEKRPQKGYVFSLPVGAAVLTRLFFTNDPPSANEITAAQKAIREILHEIPCRVYAAKQQGTVIGTGGTVTSIAAMSRNLSLKDLKPERLNGIRISASQIREIFDRIKQLESSQRSRLPGLDRSRADVIIAGTLCVLLILDQLQASQLTVSLSDILEGLLIKRITGKNNA